MEERRYRKERKKGGGEAARSMREREWLKQKKNDAFTPRRCGLRKCRRLSSFLVACQGWPPVSHWESQMTALILLGSAPNQHFAH